MAAEMNARLDRFERAAMAYERLGKMTRDDEKTRALRKDTIAELAAARSAILSTAQPVRVKELEWEQVGGWRARPQSGPAYTIQRFHDGWDLLIDGHYVKPYRHGVRETYTLDAAKAAAQADYEARILSAILQGGDHD